MFNIKWDSSPQITLIRYPTSYVIPNLRLEHPDIN